MSPSTHIIPRRTATRGTRFQVRFRWRPTDATARYFSTFDRLKDAKVAEAWVASEMAAGRYPDPDRYFKEPAEQTSIGVLHDEWDEGRRHQVGDSARKTAKQAKATYGRLAAMDPSTVKVADIRRWVAGLADDGKARQTIGAYLSVLRQVLDHADLDHPNPARDPRVKLPREDTVPDDPPSWVHYQAMRGQMPPKHYHLVTFLERTGMRVGEALRFTWGDIDWNGRLLRVKSGKTRASRRWVPMVAEVHDLLAGAEWANTEPVFPGVTENSLRSAMNYACVKAGVPVYTPHDLRHRYVSLLVMAGVPAPLVGRIVGHRRVSVTIDTYSKVMLDEPAERLRELRNAAFTVPGAREIAEPGQLPQEVED